LWSFTKNPLAVKDYGPLENHDATQTFEIEALRPGKGFFVARLAGVCDRTAAEALRNVKLYVRRARLPGPEPREFYYADLIGLAVVATDGREVGTVVAVHNFGAGDLVEIQPPGGATVMLPFTEANVPTVDLAAGRLTVNPPEGMVDDFPPLKGKD
jgi:16S rRNA processing protein RimM